MRGGTPDDSIDSIRGNRDKKEDKALKYIKKTLGTVNILFAGTMEKYPLSVGMGSEAKERFFVLTDEELLYYDINSWRGIIKKRTFSMEEFKYIFYSEIISLGNPLVLEFRDPNPKETQSVILAIKNEDKHEDNNTNEFYRIMKAKILFEGIMTIKLFSTSTNDIEIFRSDKFIVLTDKSLYIDNYSIKIMNLSKIEEKEYITTLHFYERNKRGEKIIFIDLFKNERYWTNVHKITEAIKSAAEKEKAAQAAADAEEPTVQANESPFELQQLALKKQKTLKAAPAAQGAPA